MEINKRRTILYLFLCILIVASLSGCGYAFMQRRGINLIAPAVPSLVESIMKQKSGQLAKEGLPGDIILISALAEMSPKNYNLLWTAAQAYTCYGLFVEDDDPKYGAGLYRIAIDYGIRALQTNSRFRRGYEAKGIDGIPGLVKGLGKKYLPAMMWTLMPLGAYFLLNFDYDLGDPAFLLELPIALGLAERINELDYEYFFGLVHAWLICYYGVSPPFYRTGFKTLWGGGPEKVEKALKDALKPTDGAFLLPFLFYAKWYAVRYDRKDLFKEALDVVLRAPPAENPELNLLNEIAKMKARTYLNWKEKFFPF